MSTKRIVLMIMCGLLALMVVLMIVAQKIYDLFDLVKTLFEF